MENISAPLSTSIIKNSLFTKYFFSFFFCKIQNKKSKFVLFFKLVCKFCKLLLQHTAQFPFTDITDYIMLVPDMDI